MNIITLVRRAFQEKKDLSPKVTDVWTGGISTVSNNQIVRGGNTNYLGVIIEVPATFTKFTVNMGVNTGNIMAVRRGNGNWARVNVQHNVQNNNTVVSYAIAIHIFKSNRGNASVYDNVKNEYIWKGSNEDWSKWNF